MSRYTPPPAAVSLAFARAPGSPFRFGGVGNGSTDDTAALESCFAWCVANDRPMDLTGGDWVYAGNGIDPGVNKFAIIGEGPDLCSLEVAVGKYFLNPTTIAAKNFTCDGFSVVGLGGFMNVAVTASGGEATGSGRKRFHRIEFDGYMETAVQSNLNDSPHWTFQDCIFTGGSDLTSMGVAFNHPANGTYFLGCRFFGNRVGVKLHDAQDVQFLSTSFLHANGAPAPAAPRCSVWVVPWTGANTQHEALSFVGCKFGSEGHDATDSRLLFADEGAGATTGARLPDMTVASAGRVDGVRVTNCKISGAVAGPFIYSLAARVTGTVIADCPISGVAPSFMFELDPLVAPLAQPGKFANYVRGTSKGGQVPILTNALATGYFGNGGDAYSTVKLATEGVLNSVVPQADDDLVFDVQTVGTYSVQGALIVDGAAAADLKIKYSGTATMAASIVSFMGQTTTATTFNHAGFGPGTNVGKGTTGAGSPLIIPVMGTLIVTAVGTVLLSWSQDTADAAVPTQLLAGSWMRLTRISS